jgi:hypothetical protein
MPLVGERTRFGPTVKVCVGAVSGPSVAFTVCAPAAAAGTVKTQVNAPTLEVVREPEVQVRTVETSQVRVTETVPPNPVPVAVTELPTVPLVGERLKLGMTVNPAVPAFDALSVAVTVCSPAMLGGTTNVQVNPPTALVLAPTHVIGLVSHFTVYVVLAAKPVPVSETVSPTMPLVGATEIPEVTVNVAVATFDAESVAVTVWVPATAAGTANVQVHAPRAVIETEEQSVAPPGLHVALTVPPPTNPSPVAVTEVPTIPFAGASVRLGVTVKAVVAVLGVGVAESVAVTVWLPWTPEGTANVQVNPPVAPLVAVQRVAPPGLQVTVTAEPPANPVPVAVTEVPTAPLVGAIVRLAPTVNVAVAVFGVGVALSVAVTVWAPATPAGTVKVQLNPPVAELVVVQRVAPPGLQVTLTADVAAKPLPVAVTGPLPTIPLVGDSTRLVSTVNVAEAVFATGVALSVATTV